MCFPFEAVGGFTDRHIIFFIICEHTRGISLGIGWVAFMNLRGLGALDSILVVIFFFSSDHSGRRVCIFVCIIC
jgi:hypothetical protein